MFRPVEKTSPILLMPCSLIIMKKRNAALDLSRFLAAFIVLTGHFLYFDSELTDFAKIDVLQIFNTGAKSVEYFFALSGYVLAQSSKSINLNWLKARFVRLMPIYIVCYSLPIIGVLTLARSELNSQSPFLLLFGTTGLQAISSDYYLIGSNSPLWSLSVEIYLSILLLVLTHIRLLPIFMSLALALSIISIFMSHPILNALPYFLVGIGFSKLFKQTEIKRSKTLVIEFVLFLFVISYWIIFPILAPSFLSIKSAQPIIDLFFIAATLVLFVLVSVPNKIHAISIQLGLRSYVMYASHAPILRIYNQAWVRLVTPADNIGLSVMYIFGGYICVAIGTEILFRVIEKRAITWSTKIKKSKEI